jgi:hypothetical protein
MALVESSSLPPVLERRAITVKNRVQCKQDQVVAWLQEFYTSPGNLEKLLPILQGTSPISLRLVDYFVTNYAKKMNTSFHLAGKHFLVYFNYKRELNAYSKRLFDPFCRRERIMFQARGKEGRRRQSSHPSHRSRAWPLSPGPLRTLQPRKEARSPPGPFLA